ncbi:hypothetical protein OXYTRIMIC_117 [Oxytricha trifallax]|uniref:Ubiquitin-like protease family profile domain-containing protein n=1 Tax=Oxytricha trifallax TaxID=1172189 RepID=A0A073HZK5_9SPIT|nr:hypothetical protein OXYTRIMIC_117 [Oxytricha trifallax]
MEESKFSNQKNRSQNRSSNNSLNNNQWKSRQEKRQFWEKVSEIRHSHRDRSRDQEAFGIGGEEQFKVPLNRQMGFKSRLRIGNSNPSKKMNQSQKQREQFDKHEDGSECIQGDSMKLKHLIDLTEVKCKDFDKIIYVKKGWKPMTSRMITIVCCPSTRSKVEKALVRRFTDRDNAKKNGTREKDLWSEKQLRHWEEINREWDHSDLTPGYHIQETTMEKSLSLVEEVQFAHQKLKCSILPPVVMDDKGIRQREKYIGQTNWKIENSKYWRNHDDIQSVIIPLVCLSIVKNCQNWVVLKIDKGSKKLEIYDSRRQIGSLALIQKFGSQINELMDGIMGPSYKAESIVNKQDVNQVTYPQDCGLLAILIANHLALEIAGEPIFQIFSKDWLNMQRYYLMFSLEIGTTRWKLENQDSLSKKRKQRGIWNRRASLSGTK